MNLETIKEIFNNQPFIGVMVYQEKIVYVNKNFENITGFSQKELLKLSPEEIFPSNKIKETIKKTIKKRLNGEYFPSTYEPLEIINKNNERKYIKFFTQTIKINNSYAGFVIALDISEEVKKEILIEILKDINQTVITELDENEIFNKIIANIYKKGNFISVCNIINDKNVSNTRYNIGNIKIDKFYENLNNIYKQKLFNNKHVIIDSSEKNDFNIIMNKHNINTILLLPIFKSNKLYATIIICSKYTNDFDKQTVEIFLEAKKDLEFALKKIDDYVLLKILREAIDKAYSWVVITDEKANIIYANKSVEEISKYKITELLGKNPRILKSGYHSKEFYEKFWNNLVNNKIVETIIINKDKNKKLFYLKDKIVPVIAPNGKKYYISLAIDITHEKCLQDKLKKDILTNLPNRSEFINLVLKKINTRMKYACMIFDIKDFKIFNQLNGNLSGDYILRQFSDLLKKLFYDEDIIARIGGDEFAVFVKYNSINDLYSIINKLLHKVQHLEEFHNKISLNIGISIYPKDSKDIVELIEKAYLALEIAKQKGDFTYEFFNSQINQKIIEYSEIKQLILNAIKNNEFIYYFQPYFDVKTLKIVGAETLIRIQQKDKIIYPNIFIDYAENSGYIKEIEKQMFPKLLKYIQEINIPLSFNISGKSLTDEEHIHSLFDNINNLPLVIELTEREIAGNIEYTKKIFDYFKEKNFKMSIDDFGTGYSSLTYLKDLPADFLKIDISFIKNIEHSDKDLAIVETIINFAHRFNLKTIAEGVENKNQLEILKKLNCDYIQGYYLAKPMPFEELKKIIKKHT